MILISIRSEVSYILNALSNECFKREDIWEYSVRGYPLVVQVDYMETFLLNNSTSSWHIVHNLQDFLHIVYSKRLL